MANIKSAQKRISTIERRNQENRFVRATLSTKVKKLRKLLEEGKVAEAETCSKGVIHKNAASRKVGRLAAALYKAKTTTTEVKEEVKVEEKVEAKVEATEAPVEKKTTAKRTTKKAETTEEKPAKKTTTRKTTKKAE